MTDASQNHELLHLVFEFAPDAKLLVDRGGRILMANAQAEHMFGYSREELVGELVEILIPQRYAQRHVAFRTGYTTEPRMRPMGAGVELFGVRKDGAEIPVDIMLSPLDVGSERLFMAVVRDVTERKRIETEAREAREMYIREIHHRVKNNLQVISSLLFLQSTHTTDPNTLVILKESQTRVKSIALIHEKLYRSKELVDLDFAEYVQDLVADLFRTYGIDHENLSVITHVENVSLNVDTAIPCGLIINELVSNVLKHAFPEKKGGEVQVELSRRGPNEFMLAVCDNGIGMPTDFDLRRSRSLGLRLVNDLTRQLDGHVEMVSNNGTTFRITFKELQYKERS